MKATVNIRNWIIILLCITIVCMAIGFALLSMQLEKNSSNIPIHDVSFTNINPRTPVRGGSKVPNATATITNFNQTINFKFHLYSPTDEISYRITIKNKGTIDAEIVSLIEYPDYLNDANVAKKIYPIEIKHNNIIGKVLAPGEETELKVAATFNYKELPRVATALYQITILTKSPEK